MEKDMLQDHRLVILEKGQQEIISKLDKFIDEHHTHETNVHAELAILKTKMKMVEKITYSALLVAGTAIAGHILSLING